MHRAFRSIFHRCLEPKFYRDTTVARSAPGGLPAGGPQPDSCKGYHKAAERPHKALQAAASQVCCLGKSTLHATSRPSTALAPTAAPGPRRMSTIHARRPYGTVDPMAGCVLLPPVLGSCGGLSAPSNDAHRRGEQRYRRVRLSGIISQQPAINACGQR